MPLPPARRFGPHSPDYQPSESRRVTSNQRSLVHQPQGRFTLKPVEARWVEEYLINLDPRTASISVGLPPERGRTLLSSPRIQKAISLAKRRRSTRTQIYADEVLRRWNALATADPREIIELRRVNCRHCHGIGHKEQFNDIEYEHAVSKHGQAMMFLPEPDRIPFDEKGGAGFKVNAPPYPECPNCGGDGILRAIIKDSQNYSPSALLLFDGIRHGAGGSVEVKFRDRSLADTNIAKHTEMFRHRIEIEEFNPNRMTDDQLEAMVLGLAETGVIDIEAEDVVEDTSDFDEDPSITDIDDESLE